MEKKISGFVKEIQWTKEYGWGNGYAVIPEGHPLHGIYYDEIYVEVHGGLTFSHAADELGWPEILPEHKGGWIIGFDCAHYGDTQSSWPKSLVEAEVERLINSLNQPPSMG